MANFDEQVIRTADGVTRVVLDRQRRAGQMSPRLAEVIELLAQKTLLGRKIADDIDDAVARDLWARLQDAEKKVQRRYRQLRKFSLQGNAFSALVIMGAAAADGMSYAGTELVREVVGENPFALGTRWQQRVRGAIVFAASALSLPKDFRSLAWLARQPFERGLTGLCRHYASVLQALFFAAQRATGRWRGATVLTVWGRARRRHMFHHAWTWLCEPGMNRIVPIDLTGADWLLDNEVATDIINQGFDASRFLNASSFATNLVVGYSNTASAAYRDARVRALLHEMVSIDRAEGRALLARLCVHPGLHRETVGAIRGRIQRDVAAPRLARRAVGDAAIQKELVTELLDACSGESRPPMPGDDAAWSYRTAPRR